MVDEQAVKELEPGVEQQKLESIAGLKSDDKSVVPFEPNHLESVEPFEDFMRKLMARPMSFERLLFMAEQGLSASILKDDKTLASTGIMPLWDGVGEVWAIVSRQTKDATVTFHKTCKRLMGYYASKLDLWRIQCFVECNNPRTISWITRLGFNPEGTLKEYGPDKSDWIIMAKPWEG